MGPRQVYYERHGVAATARPGGERRVGEMLGRLYPVVLREGAREEARREMAAAGGRLPGGPPSPGSAGGPAIPDGEAERMLAELRRPEPASYAELAGPAAGPGDAAQRRLLAFMEEQHIPAYDPGSVREYLAERARLVNRGVSPHRITRAGSWLHWVPLRARDDQGAALASACRALGGEPPSPRMERTYQRPIPLEVLGDALALSREFGPRAALLVSDLAHDPDPFIAVSLDGQDPVVFGVWDEPGYEQRARPR